jgi:hypothetical protein
MRKYDPKATYINLLTASEPGAMNTREGPVPLALDSDHEAIGVGLYSSLAGPEPRVCRIKSTARLDEFWVSEALLDEVKHNSKLTLIEKPTAVKLDQNGNLF